MTAKYNIEQKPPQNQSGRYGRKIVAIVDHITAGQYPGCLSWMRNSAAKASSHYLITSSGFIIQMVPDANASAYAARGLEWLLEVLSTIVVHILYSPLIVVLMIGLVACRVLH